MSLPRYRCHKVVEAFKIGEVNVTLEGAILTSEDGAYTVIVPLAFLDRHNDGRLVGGYFVKYDDGYQSWSPRAAFESGYALIAVLLVLALLGASPAFAEMPTAHKVGLSLYATGAALDLHSTYLVLSSPGGRENNPLGRLTDGRPAATIVVGAAADAVVTTLLYKWLGKDHPTLTTVLLVTATSVRLSLAASNYRVERRPWP